MLALYFFTGWTHIMLHFKQSDRCQMTEVIKEVRRCAVINRPAKLFYNRNKDVDTTFVLLTGKEVNLQQFKLSNGYKKINIL